MARAEMPRLVVWLAWPPRSGLHLLTAIAISPDVVRTPGVPLQVEALC